VSWPILGPWIVDLTAIASYQFDVGGNVICGVGCDRAVVA
jgi:hypothetical protein